MKHVSNILKFLLAGGIIAWLLRSGLLDLHQLVSLLQGDFLVAGLLICFLSIFMNNYRWYLLLRCQGFKVSVGSTLSLTFIGLFFNMAMPGGVGGDLVKGYYIVQDHPDRRMASAASIFVDRVIGFISMVMMSLAALALNLHLMDGREDLKKLAWGALALMLLFVAFTVAAFSRRSKATFERIFGFLPGGRVFARLHEVFFAYRGHARVLAYSLVLSLISQICTVIFFMMVGSAMKVPVSPQAYFFVVPVGLIAMAAPIAPAGIGVGQAAFLALFNMYLGYNSTIGPTAATANQIVMLIWGLFGAVFYFRRRKPVWAEASRS
jgi:uncharacterized protein (TIRG00374 family)